MTIPVAHEVSQQGVVPFMVRPWNEGPAPLVDGALAFLNWRGHGGAIWNAIFPLIP